MPSVTHVLLPYTAFFYYTSLHISSMSPSSLSLSDIGALARHPSLPPPLPDSVDVTLPDLQQLNTDLRHITIAHASGNLPTITTLDFSRFQRAKTITIGSHCFRYVTNLKMAGLPALERVKIGMNSMQHIHEEEEGWDYDYLEREGRGGDFTLKNCPKVKELVLGDGVMAYGEVCVIEDVPALEEIVMGDMDNFFLFGCFKNASLELKSWGDGGK